MKVKFHLVRLVLISFGIFVSSLLVSQNAPITTAGSGSVCPGGTISIPLTVTSFNQIAAVSLQLDFNPTLLSYTGYTNLNSSISGCNVNEDLFSPTLHRIMVVWSDVNPIDLANGSKLVDLNFTLLSGSPVVSFNNIANGGGNCEYAGATANPLNDSPTATYYINATVTNTGAGAAGSISGSASVDQGQTGVAYSVPAVTNATSYTWAYSGTGATIHGTSNNVTIDFAANATSGNLTVSGTNTCGNGTVSANYPITVNTITFYNLSVKIFLEGPFNGTDMEAALNTNNLISLAQPYNTPPWNYAGTESVAAIPTGVVDWVLVELRDATLPANATPSTTLSGWPKAMFLKQDGSIVNTNGSQPSVGLPVISNNLYVVIRHRNHIAVMSATGMVLATNTYSFDFSTSVSQAFGAGAGYKEIETGVFGMVAGDSDSDSEISVLDFSEWATDFGNTGIYFTSDIDADGEVSVLDFSKWATNFGIAHSILGNQTPALIKSQIPEQN